MNDLQALLNLFSSYFKHEPIYYFILDSFPLMILSVWGAMTKQFNSNCDITSRSTKAGISGAVTIALCTNSASLYWELPIFSQVPLALLGGYHSKSIIDILFNKLLSRLKKTKW